MQSGSLPRDFCGRGDDGEGGEGGWREASVDGEARGLPSAASAPTDVNKLVR